MMFRRKGGYENQDKCENEFEINIPTHRHKRQVIH